jgi:hypothetical protein
VAALVYVLALVYMPALVCVPALVYVLGVQLQPRSQPLLGPRQPAHDGSQRYLELFRDLLVGALLEVKHHQHQPKFVRQGVERLAEQLAVERRCAGRFDRQVLHVQFDGVARQRARPTAGLEEAIPQDREQPTAHALGLTNLVQLFVSRHKRLLCQIFRIGGVSGKTKGVAVEGRVMLVDQPR